MSSGTKLTTEITHTLFNAMSGKDALAGSPNGRLVCELDDAVRELEYNKKRLASSLDNARRSIEFAMIQVAEDRMPNSCGIIQSAAEVEINNGKVHASHTAAVSMLRVAVAMGIVEKGAYFIA